MPALPARAAAEASGALILIDGRRTRTDLGPANGTGQHATRIANVPFEDVEAALEMSEVCPVCGGPKPIGRIGCSKSCARSAWGRRLQWP